MSMQNWRGRAGTEKLQRFSKFSKSLRRSVAGSFAQGGFHPGVYDPVARKPVAIEYIPAPSKIEILLRQHVGAAAKPLVDIGEYVCSGKLLAENTAEGPLYSRIHSPIPGIVTALENRMLAGGFKTESIVIEHEEPLRSESTETGKPNADMAQECSWRNNWRNNWRDKSYAEILRCIAEGGVVGMGGAAFPTDVKLYLPEDRHCDYLLLNATECEPYLHSDAGLLEEMAFDVIGGIDVLATGLKPRYIVVGLEENKRYLLPKLEIAIKNYRGQSGTGGRLPPVRIALLKTRYPQGAEALFIQAISGREMAPGQRPLDVGCLTINVATGKAIYDAVARALPLTRRIVTVSGGAVKTPKVFDAPLGTPLSDLLERCGGIHRPVVRMVSGGPLMGESFYDLQQFVTKGSGGFLFLTKEEVMDKKERPCIQCDACLQVCPMGLEPNSMYRYIQGENWNAAINIGLLSCIECGACVSSCPSHIPLTQGFRMGKMRWQEFRHGW
ncbi:MAG: RnfABCDGE type electron transport complex subunit C [Spirochaetota bacterium]